MLTLFARFLQKDISVISQSFYKTADSKRLRFRQRQRQFFVPFKNGLGAVLWCCSQVTSKRSKVPHKHVSRNLSTGGCGGDVHTPSPQPGRCPLDRHPLWVDTLPPGQTPPGQTATAADGTHPIGMHSCIVLYESTGSCKVQKQGL